MAKPVSEAISITKGIFENILFLEEVFQSSANEEIPDVPFLELARSFQLKGSAAIFPPGLKPARIVGPIKGQ